MLIPLGVALLILLFTQKGLLRLGVLDRFELSTLDYRFALRGPVPIDSSEIVIVEINEESFRSIPDRFPWPRSLYARLLRNLKLAGARAVGFDLILGSPDAVLPEDDALFRSTIRSTGIAVLAGKVEQDQRLYTSVSRDRNFGNVFYDVDSALGLVNIRPDDDGIYRAYAVAFHADTSTSGGILVPTFGFAALNRFLGIGTGTVPVRQDGTFLYAGRRLPAADATSVLINYYGPSGTFPHVAFHDVIDDASYTTVEEASTGESIDTFSDPDYGILHDDTFRNKIVLVGVTVPEYKDLFPVPLGHGRQRGDNLMYGVELHANLIANVLANDLLRLQDRTSEILMVIALTFIAFIATSRIKELPVKRTAFIELAAAAAAFVLAAAVAYLTMEAFRRWGLVLAATPALLAVGLGYISSTTYHFIQERNKRLLIKSMFSTYVNPQLVDQLVNDPSKLVLGGKREELTVLFSDIEGFTTISEDQAPERLVALLNEYLSEMSAIIFANRGTVDKYVGDAIMAFWGAPLPEPDHAYLACRSALEMERALRELNRRWNAAGRPPLRARIGLNTGPMIIGNMGAARKFNYTVIGDSVNLASRLEGVNKEYGTGLIVSESTYAAVRERIAARRLDRIAVKGRSAPVTIYELLGERGEALTGDLAGAIGEYEAGLELYFDRRFREAAEAFGRVLQIRADDVPAQVFLSRAREFAAVPPPPEWDGVYVMRRK
jgi:adenylate cyclase